MSLLSVLAALCLLFLDSKPPSPALLSKARFVEGRVVMPAATPADERVEVVAHAIGLPAFNDFAVSPGESGRFKVAFAHDARRGRLQLRSRYAVLQKHEAWTPSAEPREFELVPVLGTWLVGRVSASVGIDKLRGAEVLLQGFPARSGGRILERSARLAADGSFEFGGLACDHAWSATVVAEGHRPLRIERIECGAGKRVLVNWTLSRGVVLSGRVVDETGAGIGGARLVFDCRSDPLAPLPAEIAEGIVSGSDGSFVAAGLHPGDVLVRVECVERVPSSVEFDDLGEDEARTGLVIVLERGIRVRGRVVDPEGVPVAGVRLSIAQARPGFAGLVHALESGADGTFSCAGLSALPLRLTAEKISSERVLRTEVADVDPLSQDLVVNLAERYTLRGRVLDDLGRTLLRYTVGVRRIDANDPAPKPRVINVHAQDGAFAVDDLAAGPWEVFVYGTGLVFEPARRIELPHPVDDIVFVVRRPAVISGRVLHADGSRAARALVQVEWDRPAMFGGGMMKEESSVTASLDGEFELTEVFPGRVRVRAVSEKGSEHGSTEVDLVSGEKRSGLALSIAP